MRSFVLIAGLAALAVASPMPQDLDKIDLSAELPDLDTVDVSFGSNPVTVVYDPSAAAADAVHEIQTDSTDILDQTAKRSLEQRAACDPLPAGTGPSIRPDTVDNFLKSDIFSSAATTTTTPDGYLKTFENQKASLSGCGYLTTKTYTSYNVAKAAADCNKISGCRGFNIFYERDPSQSMGSACPNPDSVTNIKATFWANNVAPNVATNFGQYRNKFQVVIAGSNGYSMTAAAVRPVSISGYTQEVLGDCSIQAPGTACETRRADTYIRGKTFDDAFFDHGRCQAICDSIDICNFFTSYMLVTNGKCGSQQCAFYQSYLGKDRCTNKGQISRDGDSITHQWSSSFTSTSGTANCPVAERKLFRL